MTTYLKIIEGAYLDIGVKAAEAPLAASETSDGMGELLDMLAEWDALDILTGIEPTTDTGADMMEPRGFTSGIRANLAVRLAGQYEKPVTQSLAVKASQGLAAIVTINSRQTSVDKPSTLPMGAGNRQDYTTDRDFFPEQTERNF